MTNKRMQQDNLLRKELIEELVALSAVKAPDLKRVEGYILANQMTAEEVTYTAIKVCEKAEYEISEYLYRHERMPEQGELLTNNWVALFDVFIRRGLDANMVFPGEGPDEDNILWALHTIQDGDVAPTILRNLLQKNGDPNTKVMGHNFFQGMDWDLLWDVREGTEKWLFDIHFHIWLVLMGFGGYINDHQCPVKMAEGYDQGIFQEFEKFDYTIEHGEEDWTMHIFFKETGEEVAIL